MESRRLFDILRVASREENLPFLKPFEIAILMDRFEAYRTYGIRTRITSKQETVLEEIAQKLHI